MLSQANQQFLDEQNKLTWKLRGRMRLLFDLLLLGPALTPESRRMIGDIFIETIIKDVREYDSRK